MSLDSSVHKDSLVLGNALPKCVKEVGGCELLLNDMKNLITCLSAIKSNMFLRSSSLGKFDKVKEVIDSLVLEIESDILPELVSFKDDFDLTKVKDVNCLKKPRVSQRKACISVGASTELCGETVLRHDVLLKNTKRMDATKRSVLSASVSNVKTGMSYSDAVRGSKCYEIVTGAVQSSNQCSDNVRLVNKYARFPLKTEASYKANSKFKDVTLCRGKCYNCGDRHHEYVCKKKCTKCKWGPDHVPSECKILRSWTEATLKRKSVPIVPEKTRQRIFYDKRSYRSKAYSKKCKELRSKSVNINGDGNQVVCVKKPTKFNSSDARLKLLDLLHGVTKAAEVKDRVGKVKCIPTRNVEGMTCMQGGKLLAMLHGQSRDRGMFDVLRQDVNDTSCVPDKPALDVVTISTSSDKSNDVNVDTFDSVESVDRNDRLLVVEVVELLLDNVTIFSSMNASKAKCDITCVNSSDMIGVDVVVACISDTACAVKCAEYLGDSSTTVLPEVLNEEHVESDAMSCVATSSVAVCESHVCRDDVHVVVCDQLVESATKVLPGKMIHVHEVESPVCLSTSTDVICKGDVCPDVIEIKDGVCAVQTAALFPTTLRDLRGVDRGVSVQKQASLVQKGGVVSAASAVESQRVVKVVYDSTSKRDGVSHKDAQVVQQVGVMSSATVCNVSSSKVAECVRWLQAGETVPEYSEMISCSTESSYWWLRNHCIDHEYILMGKSSDRYDVACRDNLRRLLSRIDVKDVSVLYQLAKRYLVEFPLTKEQVMREYKAFEVSHADIVSGVYAANERNCVSGIEDVWSGLIAAMTEVKCWSSNERCKLHSQRLREFRIVCLNWRNERRNANRMEASLDVVNTNAIIESTDKYFVSGANNSLASVDGGKVPQCKTKVVDDKLLLAVKDYKCEVVTYIPEYSKEISCSKEECYNALYDQCVDNVFIIQGRSSHLYTTECWYMLGYNLQCMNPEDRSVLCVLCEKYFAKHPLPKDRILNEYKVLMTKLSTMMSTSDSDEKYNSMRLSMFEWQCISLAMNKVDGWYERPAGERELSAKLWNDFEESCTEWLNNREAAAVQSRRRQALIYTEVKAIFKSVCERVFERGAAVTTTDAVSRRSLPDGKVHAVHQEPRVKRRVTKKSSVSRSGISLNIGINSREFEKASENSLWRQDYLNKIFFDSSDDEDEEEGDSVSIMRSSSSECGGYYSDHDSDDH